MFHYTTAIKKLRKLSKRIKKVPGGTSAGKTYGILPVLIQKACKQGLLEISVVSESIPHLKRGAIKDFKKIMKETGRWIPDHWHGTDLKYTFSTSSFIEFFSADSEDKVRGPRRNILYINECNNISFETYHQLAIRTDQEIWLDYNPTNEFWIHTELADDEDVEELILTYKDNEALAESLVKEIEKARKKAFHNEFLPDLFAESNIKSAYWANWWKVYGLGLIGSLEGVIFSNWKQIDSIPHDAKLISHGLDFGYTNDPTACTSVYIWNGKLVINENFYQKGLLNSDIKDLINSKGLSKEKPIYADSAEPKSIAELTMSGIFTKPAIKGTDSIKFGIDYLQQYELLITSQSVNLIKELRNYQWEKDKEGKVLNKPIDAFNHGIDSVRYAVCELSMPQRQRRTT
jgi:phage terminase large subunit